LTVTKIIPYPAAIVDYKPVSYFQWADNVNTLLNFYQKQNQVNPEIKFPNLIDTEKHAFNLIIDQLLLDELAKKYQVSITKEEITQQTNRVAKEIGNQTALEKQIKNLYDWDLTKFQQEIIKPIILKSKINLALNYNDVLNATALQEINYIAAKLKTAPALFEDLAKAYSQDLATANQGGDLGYISRDQTVPEFEKEAFTLEPGQISDIIITEFGFHLIKVEEKLTDDNGQVTQVKVKHILVKGKSLDEYLNEMKNKTKIWQLITI
jgi:parvulin-like peptidyl-prolyl isomerase